MVGEPVFLALSSSEQLTKTPIFQAEKPHPKTLKALPERVDLNTAYRESGKLPGSGQGVVPQDLLSVVKVRQLEPQEISTDQSGLHTPLEMQSIGKKIVLGRDTKRGVGKQSTNLKVHPSPIASPAGRRNFRTGNLKLSYYVYCSEKQDRLRGESPMVTESPE